jgi:hypothetical protein
MAAHGLTNINDRATEVMHATEAEAWEAYRADEKELVGTEVLVSAMEVFDEETEANPFEQTYDPPKVGRVRYYDYRLRDDAGAGILHPLVGLEVDGVEGWTDGRAHMWMVNNA